MRLDSLSELDEIEEESDSLHDSSLLKKSLSKKSNKLLKMRSKT